LKNNTAQGGFVFAEVVDMKPISLSVLLIGVLSASAAQAETLNRGLPGFPNTVDPQLASTPVEGTVLLDLFEGLVSPAPDGSPVPGVAEAWHVSGDGLVWTFTLRDDARWSDGTPVTAIDFVTAFQRLVDPRLAAPTAGDLSPIVGAEDIIAGREPVDSLGVTVEASDLLRVELTAPIPYFLDLMNTPSTMPVPTHLVVDGTFDTGPGAMVSNGAYQLAASVLGATVTLVANPHYWDAEGVAFDEVVFHSIEDRAAAFQAGELDYVLEAPLDQLTEIQAEIEDSLWISPRSGSYFYALNPSIPGLDDARVRRALNLLVDRDRLVDLGSGFEVPAFSYVPPGTANYNEPAKLPFSDQPMFERVDTAMALLAEAGYGPEGEALSLELRISEADTHRRWAVAIADMWAEANVEISIVGADISAHWQHMMMRSDNTVFNYQRWADPTFDQLVNDAASEADLERRADLLREAEGRLLMSDVVIPLFFPVNVELVSTGLAGWSPNMGLRHRSQNARPVE